MMEKIRVKLQIGNQSAYMHGVFYLGNVSSTDVHSDWGLLTSSFVLFKIEKKLEIDA